MGIVSETIQNAVLELDRLEFGKGVDCMRKIIALTLVFICLLSLCGCNNNTADTTAEHEAVSTDYGKVIDLAKAEFAEVFKEFGDVRIEETATMTRTDDAKEIVVQIKYSSSNGDGVYGFLYNLDDYANPELVQHGENTTIDNLLK